MDDYVVLGARVTAGLLAGLYLAFVVAVRPALHQLGDAKFVGTMNQINVSIVNARGLRESVGALQRPALLTGIGSFVCLLLSRSIVP